MLPAASVPGGAFSVSRVRARPVGIHHPDRVPPVLADGEHDLPLVAALGPVRDAELQAVSAMAPKLTPKQPPQLHEPEGG